MATTIIGSENSECKAIISIPKTDVIYVGIDNEISIKVPGYDHDDVFAKLNSDINGVLEKKDSGKFVLKVLRRNTGTCAIEVSVKTPSGALIPKGNAQYQVSRLPSPYPVIQGSSGGEISHGQLKVVSKIDVWMDQFPYKGLGFKVTDYSYLYQSKSGNTIQGENRGSSIPNALKFAFNNAEKGDYFIIDRIKAAAVGIGTLEVKGALVLYVN